MRAERRQELRTNELAQMLDDAREFFRVWGSYVLGGAVIVVLVIAFAVYRAKAAHEQHAESWKSLQAVAFFDAAGQPKSDVEVRQSFARLDELAAEDHGPDFLFEVLSTKAQAAASVATASQQGISSDWLAKAAEAYEAMRTRLPDNPLAVAMALNGLANVEADRFVVDGDPNRKKTARELLEKLRDDPRFSGTPFQRAALDRINRLDEVFQRVEFAAAPPPPEFPAGGTLTPFTLPELQPEPEAETSPDAEPAPESEAPQPGEPEEATGEEAPPAESEPPAGELEPTEPAEPAEPEPAPGDEDSPGSS